MSGAGVLKFKTQGPGHKSGSAPEILCGPARTEIIGSCVSCAKCPVLGFGFSFWTPKRHLATQCQEHTAEWLQQVTRMVLEKQLNKMS